MWKDDDPAINGFFQKSGEFSALSRVAFEVSKGTFHQVENTRNSQGVRSVLSDRLAQNHAGTLADGILQFHEVFVDRGCLSVEILSTTIQEGKNESRPRVLPCDDLEKNKPLVLFVRFIVQAYLLWFHDNAVLTLLLNL